MGSVLWDKRLSVGSAILDEDHRDMMDALNKLNENLDSPERLQEVFNRFVHLTGAHFKREEALMRASGFMEIKEHVREHQGFILSIGNMQEQLKNRRGAIKGELLEILRTWLLSHIMKMDGKYRGLLQDQESKPLQ